MTTSNDYGSALLDALLAVGKDKMPDIVLKLAAAGDLDTLDSIFNHPRFDPALWKGEYFGQYKMGDAILPLQDASSEDVRDKATSLIDKWQVAFGATDVAQTRFRLRSVTEPSLVRALVRRHGIALDEQGAVTYYAKQHLEGSTKIECALAAIEASVEIGNYQPMEKALEVLAEPDGRDLATKIGERLLAISLPEQARTGFGQKAVEQILANHSNLGTLQDTTVTNTSAAWLLALQIADVQPAQWRAIGELWTKFPTLPRVIASTPSLAEHAIPALRQVLANGADVENLLTNERLKVTMPILHKAAASDNATLVQFLLSSGANPDRAIGTRTFRNAAECAPEGSASKHVILSWRARQAMDAIRGRSKAKSMEVVAYHGTPYAFEEFNKNSKSGWHFGTIDQASHMLSIKLAKATDVDFDELPQLPGGQPGHMIKAALTFSAIKRISDQRTDEAWAAAIEAGKNDGLDGYVYSNEYEGRAGEDSYVVFSPSQIRVLPDCRADLESHRKSHRRVMP